MLTILASLTTVLPWILKLLSTPMLQGVSEVFKTWAQTDVQKTQAKYQALTVLAQAELQAKSQISLKLIDAIGGKAIFFSFVFPLGIYFNKAVLFDKVLGPALGYSWATDPLNGEIGIWAGIIIGAIFGHSAVLKIADRVFR